MMSISTAKDNSKQMPHTWWNNKVFTGMSRPQNHACGRHGLFQHIKHQLLQSLAPSLHRYEEYLKATNNKLGDAKRIHQLGLDSKFLSDVTIPDGHTVSAVNNLKKFGSWIPAVKVGLQERLYNMLAVMLWETPSQFLFHRKNLTKRLN